MLVVQVSDENVPIRSTFFSLGAASLDVEQEIEYCMPEARIMSLLAALQKTPPPVSEICGKMCD